MIALLAVLLVLAPVVWTWRHPYARRVGGLEIRRHIMRAKIMVAFGRRRLCACPKCAFNMAIVVAQPLLGVAPGDPTGREWHRMLRIRLRLCPIDRLAVAKQLRFVLRTAREALSEVEERCD